MATGFARLTRKDYDREPSRTFVRAATRSAANWDAQTALLATFMTTLAAITEQPLTALVREGNEQVNSKEGAASTYAQRELKWLVQYIDSADKPGRFYIPCAKTALLDPNDRAHAEIGDGDVVDAFVDAAEAFVLSDDGNAITIQEITLVGRNV